MNLRFTVYGKPIPQGSKKSMRHKHTGNIITVEDNVKTKPWRQEIVRTAIEQRPVMSLKAVGIVLDFYFDRPKSVSEAKRPHVTVKPDVDKCVRNCLDALTGICWKDDAQVVDVRARKHYGTPERVEIMVGEI